MFRKVMSICGFLLLGAVLLLAAPVPAFAQRGGRGGMGMGMGTGFGMGMGNGMGTGMRPGGGLGGLPGTMPNGGMRSPGSNGGHHHGYWPNAWWGRGYASGYYGAYMSMAPYSGGYGYANMYSSSYNPSGYVVPPSGYSSDLAKSNYPRLNGPAIPESSEDRAHIAIQLPPDADVSIDGVILNATGSIREFDSPPLPSGKPYTYNLEVKWNENGKEVTQSQRIEVTAGSRTEVIFRSGAKPSVRGEPKMPAPATP